MKLNDISPNTLSTVKNTELVSLHHRIHQLYSSAKKSNNKELLKILKSKHGIILSVMDRRNMKHKSDLLECTNMKKSGVLECDLGNMSPAKKKKAKVMMKIMKKMKNEGRLINVLENMDIKNKTKLVYVLIEAGYIKNAFNAIKQFIAKPTRGEKIEKFKKEVPKLTTNSKTIQPSNWKFAKHPDFDTPESVVEFIRKMVIQTIL